MMCLEAQSCSEVRPLPRLVITTHCIALRPRQEINSVLRPGGRRDRERVEAVCRGQPEPARTTFSSSSPATQRDSC